MQGQGRQTNEIKGTRLVSVRKYSLCPFLIVAVGVRATSLTRFVENTCNICISK
jgi:hypothetical protein